MLIFAIKESGAKMSGKSQDAGTGMVRIVLVNLAFVGVIKLVCPVAVAIRVKLR